MAKQKIVFYGTCQVAAISKYFEKFLPQYEILDCKDCGVTPWGGSKSFSLFWTKDDKKRQDKFYPCVHEAISKADFFIFQHASAPTIHDKLKTQYLQNEVANPSGTQSICVHYYRERIYPEIPFLVSFARSRNVQDPEEALNFIQTTESPAILKKLEYNFLESMRQNNIVQNKANKIYNNYISMNDFIKNNYKTKHLSYSYLHPTEIYFSELISRILDRLGKKNYKPIPSDIDHPDWWDYTAFNIFNKAFPDIELHAKLGPKCGLKYVTQKLNANLNDWHPYIFPH